MTEYEWTGPAAKGRRWAALTLIVLAPVCAELTFGAMPLSLAPLLLPILIPMYGAGVLLIRELVRRVRGGWPSLLVLGLAYELAEDGLGLQALTSPNLYNAADWGPRILGFNTTYWEAQIGYHLAFSVLIPILLTDLLFPRHRDRPYLKRGGLIGIGIVAVVGVGLVRLTIPLTEDPGYQAPLPVLIGLVLAIGLLAVLALRVLPGQTPVPATAGTAPAPAVVGGLAALTTAAFLAMLLHPADVLGLGGSWVPLLMAVAAVLAVGAGRQLYLWFAATNWTDRHRIWLAGGALVAHTLFGALFVSRTTFDAIGLQVLAGVTVILLGWLARHVDRRQISMA